MYTLRCYSATSNKHMDTLVDTQAPHCAVHAVVVVKPDTELGYQIYPGSGDASKTLFDPFPRDHKLHVLCTTANEPDSVYALSSIASHEQYLYFKLLGRATSYTVYVTLAPSASEAVRQVERLIGSGGKKIA